MEQEQHEFIAYEAAINMLKVHPIVEDTLEDMEEINHNGTIIVSCDSHEEVDALCIFFRLLNYVVVKDEEGMIVTLTNKAHN